MLIYRHLQNLFTEQYYHIHNNIIIMKGGYCLSPLIHMEFEADCMFVDFARAEDS